MMTRMTAAEKDDTSQLQASEQRGSKCKNSHFIKLSFAAIC